MSRWLIGVGAGLVVLALGWAALLGWRLGEESVGPQDGETATVVVSFGWVQLLGAVGLLLLSIGVLSRMRRKRRPRL